MSKKKSKKLDTYSKIHKRLFKKWSLCVRERAFHKCEFCGISKGEKNINGKPTKIDAHHFISRDIRNCPLKWEIMNGIAVCPICHKFGIPSFHRDPITTITWLQKNSPERYEYVLNNSTVRIDLDNRHVLEYIEKCLDESKSIDFNELNLIQSQFPRKVKPTEISGSLFEDCETESESSDVSESSESD